MKKSVRHKHHKSYFEVLSGLYTEAELAKIPKKLLTEIAERMYLAGKLDLLPDDESEYDDNNLDVSAIRANVQAKSTHIGNY